MKAPPAAAVLLIAGLILPLRSWGAPPAGWTDRLRVSGSVTLTAAYYDNLLDYSDDDLALLGSNLKPLKFGVNRPDDLVASLRARVQVSTEFFRSHPTQLRVRAASRFLRSSSVGNSVSGGLDLRQFVFRDTYVEVGAAVLPRYYLRNLYYAHLRNPGRLASQYFRAEFSRRTVSAEVGHEFGRSVSAEAGYTYGWTVYNREFAERDNAAHEAQLRAEWKVFPWLRVGAGARTGFQLARGRAMSDSIADISRRTHTALAEVTLLLTSLTGLPLSVALDLLGEYEEYLSTKRYDPVTAPYGDRFHYGRIDRLYELQSTVTWELLPPLDVFFDYVWRRSTTSLDETADMGRFQAHELGGGLRFSF